VVDGRVSASRNLYIGLVVDLDSSPTIVFLVVFQNYSTGGSNPLRQLHTPPLVFAFSGASVEDICDIKTPLELWTGHMAHDTRYTGTRDSY
jgi:hypothetical protein